RGANVRVDGQEPDMRRERWTSGRLVAKSIFIKDAKRRSGNCAWKATELTPGGLLRVPTSELRASQGVLTADAEVSRGHIRPSSRQGEWGTPKPKGGETDRPSRERGPKARTI